MAVPPSSRSRGRRLPGKRAGARPPLRGSTTASLTLSPAEPRPRYCRPLLVVNATAGARPPIAGATVTIGRVRLSIGIATERPWWKHYDPGVPRTLTYPAIPLQQFLSDTAARHPRSIATIFGAVIGHRLIEGSLTYAELDRLADRFAAGLQSLGVRKGDRVAPLLPNCPQFVIAFYGALRAGAVVVPCNPLYTAHELRRQLADSGTETLVALSRLHAVARAARDGTKVRNLIF